MPFLLPNNSVKVLKENTCQTLTTTTTIVVVVVAIVVIVVVTVILFIAVVVVITEVNLLNNCVACNVLRNGTMYGSKILHADPCNTCVGCGLGLMSMGAFYH